ncbi:MAG: prolyl oligopeptidase family serine peptidase [Elusimicrobia bacterium]|nr:prolyl oligopeptidase family serine peptidase [Elusimicrobiota bacterium]
MTRASPAKAQAARGRPRLRAVILAAALLCPAGARAARTVVRKVSAGGLERSYRLHVPDAAKIPAPLVVALHGGGGTARGMVGFSRLVPLSDREGFIVAYPESGSRNWYDGREGEFSGAHRDRRDDAAFIVAMIDAIHKEHPVDQDRVYATGVSNGAFLSNYIAATHAKRFAAIAPVVGGIADPFHKAFAPEEPVSVLVVQGTEDPLVPYGGGNVARGRGKVIATEEALRLWVKADGCEPEPRTDLLPDLDPGDGCRVERSVWSGCRGGTEVVLLKMAGAGHAWPGGSQYLPKRIIGRVCRDFDSSLIWEFFKSHPKPARP